MRLVLTQQSLSMLGMSKLFKTHWVVGEMCEMGLRWGACVYGAFALKDQRCDVGMRLGCVRAAWGHLGGHWMSLGALGRPLGIIGGAAGVSREVLGIVGDHLGAPREPSAGARCVLVGLLVDRGPMEVPCSPDGLVRGHRFFLDILKAYC